MHRLTCYTCASSQPHFGSIAPLRFCILKPSSSSICRSLHFLEKITCHFIIKVFDYSMPQTCIIMSQQDFSHLPGSTFQAVSMPTYQPLLNMSLPQHRLCRDQFLCFFYVFLSDVSCLSQWKQPVITYLG